MSLLSSCKHVIPSRKEKNIFEGNSEANSSYWCHRPRGHKTGKVGPFPPPPEGGTSSSVSESGASSFVPQGQGPQCSGLRGQGCVFSEHPGWSIELKRIILKPQINGICASRFLTCLGPNPFLPSNLSLLEWECFSSTFSTTVVWYYRFANGEELCSRMNLSSYFTHNWSGWFKWDFKLTVYNEMIKSFGDIKMNFTCILHMYFTCEKDMNFEESEDGMLRVELCPPKFICCSPNLIALECEFIWR